MRRAAKKQAKRAPKKAPEGWRKVEDGFWWRPDVGSATWRSEGWFASSSGYASVILTPSVGPFKTPYEAMYAWERLREKRLRKSK